MKTLEIKLNEIPIPPIGTTEEDNEKKIYFDEEWLFKPVFIKGIFDHSKETFVERTRDGDRGLEVITPLYTDVDAKTGHLQGLLVNRGRIPLEYRDSKIHHNTAQNEISKVEGVIFYSEGRDRFTDNMDEKKKF